MTGKDFEFLLTSSADIDIRIEDFDRIMTPDSMDWEKFNKDNSDYYRVGKDEFSYSFEMIGIQMTFNKEITYAKAREIADEVAKKLIKHTGHEVIVNVIPSDEVLSF